MGYYKRIRDLREDHDLTQRQLAARLRMTQTQYFRYEQGYRDIPSDILIALADLYGTSTDYILGRTDDPRFSGAQGEVSRPGEGMAPCQEWKDMVFYKGIPASKSTFKGTLP